LFGSVVLEVLLGLFFLYAWFSLACSAVTEFLETLSAQRGKQLAIAIVGMLGSELKSQFYEHGLIRSLSKGSRLPSYVPTRSFAVVTLELLGIDERNYRERIGQLQGSTAETLRTLVRSSNSYAALVSALEQWFDSTMERCSGWFRRRARWSSFATALVVAALLNVDSLDVANALYMDSQLRMSVATQAELAASSRGLQTSDVPGKPGQPSVRVSGLPMGWENSRFVAQRERLPTGLGFWFGPVLSKLLGLLTTALAGSLGAAFWFDALKRLLVLRTSVSARGLLDRFEPQTRNAATPESSPAPVMLPFNTSGPRTVTGLETHSAGIAVYPIVGVGPSQ
jgi:hypothetical protein